MKQQVINKNLNGDLINVIRIRKEVYATKSNGDIVSKIYATPKKARQYKRKLKIKLSKTASKAGYDSVIDQWGRPLRRNKLNNKEYKND